MPALVLSIISYISLAMKAAPTVVGIYDDGKALIQSLFSSGLITKDQQDSLMAWADAHQAATLAGQVPPEFVVS
jgi:hypothetical protein